MVKNQFKKKQKQFEKHARQSLRSGACRFPKILGA